MDHSSKKRYRIVLDTNVLISAIVFGGKPRQILDSILSGLVDCSLSSAILNEIKEVLQRPKFGFSSEICLHIIEELHAACELCEPVKKIDVIKSDPDDNRILECAEAAKAQFIVSGDPHLLDLEEYEGILILTPAGFIKKYELIKKKNPK